MSSKANINEVTINGVKYRECGAPQEPQTLAAGYVIVRTRDAGVHAGTILSRKGNEVVLSNARRLWYWDGAASLSELAVHGVKKPQNCKFPCEVPTITLFGVIEIIPCTQKARDSIASVVVWSAGV